MLGFAPVARVVQLGGVIVGRTPCIRHPPLSHQPEAFFEVRQFSRAHHPFDYHGSAPSKPIIRKARSFGSLRALFNTFVLESDF